MKFLEFLKTEKTKINNWIPLIFWLNKNLTFAAISVVSIAFRALPLALQPTIERVFQLWVKKTFSKFAVYHLTIWILLPSSVVIVAIWTIWNFTCHLFYQKLIATFANLFSQNLSYFGLGKVWRLKILMDGQKSIENWFFEWLRKKA